MYIIYLLLGFLFLIKGAGYMIEGASNIAKRFHVSPLIIGLTIVAFGTSAPELIISLLASIKGSNEIALGNVIGSNISNIALIIGIGAVIYPLAIRSSTIAKEIPYAILACFVLLIAVSDIYLQRITMNELSRADGFIFLLFFVIFVYYTINSALTAREEERFRLGKEFKKEYDREKPKKLAKSVTFFLTGLAGILIGGEWVVKSAITIATLLGVSEGLIALTIVAIGTSLPELAAVIAATVKKEPDIAIGGIVGSNIFNTLLILGVASSIKPLAFKTALYTDMWIMIALTAVLFFFSFMHKKITRSTGAVFVTSYICYIGFLIWRG